MARHLVELTDIHAPAAAQLHRVFGVGVVPLDGAADPREGQVAAQGLILAHDQKRLGPGAGHDAVEQRDGV